MNFAGCRTALASSRRLARTLASWSASRNASCSGLTGTSYTAGILCRLVEEGNIELLQKWIIGGVDINSADYDRRTPLHIAAADGKIEIVQLLLSNGGNPALEDRWGNSATSEAQNKNHQAVLEELLNVNQ